MEVKADVGESKTTLYMERESCESWSPAQSPVFHICMVAFLVAYLVPQTFKHYAQALRISLLIAVFLYVIWGAMYWCTYDVILWGSIFFVQNLVQVIYLFYKMRRAGFTTTFEILYAQVFEPFGITRSDFQALVQHHCKTIKAHSGDKYAVEGCASVDERVSLLVTGRMRVMYRGQYLHDVNECQFIDSAEWECCKNKSGELFQVTIEAVDRCSYLCWNREKLQYYLEANPKLEAAFEYLRGNDVLGKIRETALNSYRRNLKNINQCEEVDGISLTNIRQAYADEDPKPINNHVSE